MRVRYLIDGDQVQIRLDGRLSEWCELFPKDDVDATVRQLVRKMGG